MKKAIEFFIYHPKLVWLLLVFVFLASWATLGSMRYEYNPSVDLSVVNITTSRLGSGPEDVELSITLPLEEELLKVDGIDKIYSNSMEGVSVITLRLDHDAENKEKLRADIQKAVDRATARLPQDLIEKPLVEEQSTQLTPVMEIHLRGNVSEDLLRSAARKVSEGLREVEGVSGTKKLGYRRKEVKVFLDQAELDKLGLGINEINQAINARNVRDSGGSLTSFTTQKKVLSVGQFADPKEVGDVIVRSYEMGNLVRIRDIATVVEGYEDWEIESRTDGQRSIVLQVRKKVSADELHTARYISAYVDSIRAQMPAGIELVEVNDISRLTEQMLNVLIGNALIGVLLVLAILYFTLNRQLAFWVAMGLPFAIILTFLVMFFFGLSINGISLMALILMMGILVDDAVVVGESIQRQRERGLDPIEASVTGTLRVARPVVFAVLTTILAFMPALGMAGPDGDFTRDLPIGVAIVLLASIFESQFILPAHLAHANYSQEVHREKLLERLSHRYRDWIGVMVRNKWRSVSAFVGVFIGVLIFGAIVLKFHLYPAAEIDNINIKVELPPGANFAETREKVTELEVLVREQVNPDDLLNVVSQIGHHDTDIYGATEGRNEAWALISVQLVPSSQRELNTHRLVEILREQLKPVGGLQKLVVEPQTDIPVLGKPVEVEFIANGEERYAAAEVFQSWLENHPGAVEVWSSYKPGKDIVELKFRHEQLAGRGLTVREVIDAVRVAMDGLIVDELQTVDERVYYRLQFPPQTESRLKTLESLSVVNSRGERIYLDAVVDFVLRSGEADIKHYQGRRTVTIFAEIDRDLISVAEINQEIADFIAEQNWFQQYPNLRVWQGGELEQQQASLGSMNQMLIICLLLIFASLVLLFNSFSQPLLVMICIPFSMMGVVLCFGVQGMAVGMIALIGVVGLIGVLVNDSLVMLHTLNQLKEEKGSELNDEELARGASYRFRPIVITSMTTVAGLIPTAYGIAGSNYFISPMVMTMAWGVAFGMFITLLLLPCLYAIDRDIKQWLKNKSPVYSRKL